MPELKGVELSQGIIECNDVIGDTAGAESTAIGGRTSGQIDDVGVHARVAIQFPFVSFDGVAVIFCQFDITAFVYCGAWVVWQRDDVVGPRIQSAKDIGTANTVTASRRILDRVLVDHNPVVGFIVEVVYRDAIVRTVHVAPRLRTNFP